MTTTQAPEITPTEFVRSHGRPVPEWFNIDVLVDTEELVEIEVIRTEMREFVQEAIAIAERVRWTLAIANRFQCEIDESLNIFTDALGTDPFIVAAGVLQNLFEGTIDDDYLARIEKDHGAELPELVDELHRIQGEDINGAADRGSFKPPRKPTATSEVTR